jgi:hypothetical protein
MAQSTVTQITPELAASYRARQLALLADAFDGELDDATVIADAYELVVADLVVKAFATDHIGDRETLLERAALLIA